MKICIILSSNIGKVIGGTEPYYVAKHLGENNEIHVINPQGKENISGEKNFKTYNINFSDKSIKGHILFNLFVFFVLTKLHIKKKFDIIYTYDHTFIIGILSKLFFNIKWVSDFRIAPILQDLEFRKIRNNKNILLHISLKIYDLLFKVFISKCDFLISVSYEVKKLLVTKYGVNSKKIYVQGLGVDMDLFKPFKRKKRKSFNIVFTGSISRLRCIDKVFLALNEIKTIIPNVKLILIGEIPKEDKIFFKKIIRELNLEKFVKIRDPISHFKIPDLLNDCDVALSLLLDIEPYKVSSPAKIFEYMAMEKVIIATDILAHRKLIKNYNNGLLIKNDYKELTDAIVRIFNDKNLRKKLESNTRKSVKKYNWKIKIPKLEKKLKKIIIT